MDPNAEGPSSRTADDKTAEELRQQVTSTSKPTLTNPLGTSEHCPVKPLQQNSVQLTQGVGTHMFPHWCLNPHYRLTQTAATRLCVW
eukprot:2262192-Pyramimonas_sp.AAC.2